jgi:lipopolysaccharide/colanic/teichoic acid biosynthesis glycosyltransferase
MSWRSLRKMRGKFYAKTGKRIFDLLVGLTGFVLVSPLLIFVALWIAISDPGPIFFRHERIGQNFKKFRLIKFRTMIKNAGQAGLQITAADDKRISKVGGYLRRFKLDELPQLINVIKGEMSLVGPRPEVEAYVRVFNDDYKQILKIRPGITDFAAIEFRDEQEMLKGSEDTHASYVTNILPKKIVLYKKYLNDMSFSTDLRILTETLRSIF